MTENSTNTMQIPHIKLFTTICRAVKKQVNNLNDPNNI